MSKKDRLKAQKEKQYKLNREMELLEQQEIQDAKVETSRSAKKYRKKANKESRKNYDGILLMALKLIMLVPFVYSGIFYCLVTVAGIAMGEMNQIPQKIAVYMGMGSLVMLVGIFFTFFKKYIAGFVIIFAGTVSYMKSASYIVHKISKKLETYSGANPDLMSMDKDYMWFYYPIMIVTAISLIMAFVATVKKVRKKKRLQRERDNAPVKSIVED